MARIDCSVCGRVLRETLCPRIPNSFGDPADALCPGDAREKSKRDALDKADKTKDKPK